MEKYIATSFVKDNVRHIAVEAIKETLNIHSFNVNYLLDMLTPDFNEKDASYKKDFFEKLKKTTQGIKASCESAESYNENDVFFQLKK